MKILLTGSSGFIGSYLVDALCREGHYVVGLDREAPSWRTPDEFFHGDILDDDLLERALDGIECVFHLAAAKDDWGISREEYFRDNVKTTEKLLSVGDEKGVTKWFHYSTVGVLPRGSEPLDESAPLDPETDYGASKAEAERLIGEFSRSRRSHAVTILRPSAVFGPRNPPTTNVHRLVEAIRSGRFMMIGQGEVPKTTSYIENLVDATLFLFDGMQSGSHVYHYVDRPVMTNGELVDLIYENLGKSKPPVRLPLSVAAPLAFVSDLVARILRVDLPITAARIEKFCTPTNFAATALRRRGFRQPVANETAVARTVRWHRERGGD